MEGSIKSKIKLYFSETFRPHTKQEYAEVFSRGISESNDEKRKYPFLYIRAFVFFLILFALSVLAYRLTRYSVAYVTSILLGGMLFNIPVLTLFFELYPKKDLSLISLFTLVLAGGAVTGAFILFGYEYIYEGHGNPWVSYLWTGFWEELVKAAFAISAIALLKKKNPLVCFLIGFAVGTGYSFFEDLGYIYMYSRGGGYSVSGYGWIVLMSVARGFSCICSHAPWTGVICWAFAKFKKPFLNFRFYGVLLSSMLLHYLADVPFYAQEIAFLTGLNWGWAIEIFVVAAIIIEMYFMLKNSFKEYNVSLSLGEYKSSLSHTCNLTAVMCAVVLSVCVLTGSSLNIGYENKTIKFESDASFINYIQSGLSFTADWSREYDFEQTNYSEFVENGELKIAAQEVIGYGGRYYYIYLVSDGEFYLQSIAAKYLGDVYYCRRTVVYEGYAVNLYGVPASFPPVGNDPEDGITGGDTTEDNEAPDEAPKPLKIISYYAINENVRGVSYSVDTQSFTVTTDEEYFKGTGAVIALSVISGISLFGGLTAFIILKTKSRSKENG